MCGIAGIICGLDEPGTRVVPTVEGMLAQVRYRGPDSFVVRAWDHVCFGHARLSIVDLADTANQPLSYLDGRYWIVLNGEIYNFVEVRQELEGRGYTFRTRSDTEVVLAAYDCWGTDCLARFNGMWALAIYDRRERTCFLARDRFGVKPLYYARLNGRLLFGSEMKALLAAGVPAEPDLETVRWYFRDAGCDRGDLTPFAAIRAVPSGHYLLARDGTITVHRWWETLANRVETPPRFEDRVAEFRSLLKDAVRLRLRNDVNTAITLSGGMDSSAVFALAKGLERQHQVVAPTDGRTKRIDVFSVSYPGEAIDEAPYVNEVLRAHSERASFIYPEPGDFPSLLSDVIWHQESFVWNASVFAFHLIYKQIAQAGIRVVLEGHGSDEMLGGYPYLVEAALRTHRDRLDWPSFWQAAQCLSRTRNEALGEPARPAWQAALEQIPGASLGVRAARRLGRLRGTGGPGNRARRMRPAGYLSPELRRAPERDFTVAGEETLNPLSRALYDAFHRRIIPNVLRVFDRATMASALESRAPFLDYRVVRFVFSLPILDIVGGGETKHILREALRDALPAPIVNRSAKLGFAVALPRWFNDPGVRAHLAEIIHDPGFASHGWVDGAAFARDFDRCAREGFSWQDTARVWEVVNLSLWWRTFVSGERRLAGVATP